MSTDTPQPGPGQRTAQDLVKEIAKERGYLGEEQLARIGEINPELRREVEEALLRKDEMIGSAVLTLARNLYTSNARFVFELLQNADDNNYSTALSSGQDPYVSFEVRPDKVSIECNENGFTHENLKAICAIGKSSKVGAAGYIGEKGIGFKSVFMAAWKVHIQSNDFSFSFTHRKGDSGLGMVTPVWEDADKSLGGSSTRITLFLHTSDDPEEDARQRETIRLQFQDLQHTILLFLRKLRKVQVSFFDEDDTQTSSTTYSLRGSNSVTVKKETFEGVEERQYHVTKHIAENIPKSENRTYSEEQDRADSSTEVVLAFPLADSSTPIVENQDVFAFLPMRPMGFKFLIHTDFVTEASRQGIVTTSLRNRGLLNGIADCFIKAIEEFCQHPTLQYQWMRWLPQRNSYPWDSFWSGLLDRIESRIQEVKILRTLGTGKLDYIHKLCRLQPWLRDKNGDPLFTDLDEEIYLAKEYTRDDLKLLETYGLESMSPSDAITRVEKDLERDIKDSRMKSPATDNEWHSLAARALILLKNTATVGPAQDRLKQLRFIPLENGTWVSSSSGPLYYSHSSGSLAIPDDLDLSLIDSEAASNPDRRALFDKFGVIEALVKDVRALILKKPINPVADAGALAVSIAHLKFLYLSEVLLEENEDQAKLRGYHVYDQNMRARSPTKHDVYLTTDDAYGPSQLFRPQGDAPGFAAPFLHHNYVQEKPAILRTIRYSNAAAGVRRNTRVLDLYEVIHARCREADSFLDAQAEARQAINDGNLIYIPAHDSSPAMWTSSDRCLWNAREDMQTAYPLAYLYRTVFHRSEEDLDVLRQFFKTALGIKDSSWEDYLNEMRRLKDLKSEDFDWINDLYSSLDSERFGMMEVDTTKLRKIFAEEPLIYFNIGNVSRWYTVGECLWSSATQIRGRVALNDLYPDLEDFFVSFLGVQELTLDMAYDELKEMGSRVPPPSVAAVKETIWALNSLLDTTADPPDEEPIFRGTVFPVRYPNKSVKLQSGRTQFAIADRKALGDIFAPQAKMLDFTLDEVRRLRPFLSWLDLESRYLSTSVREISTVAGGLMDKLQYQDREFRQKADGLFRIAVHFNSPRTSEDSSELYWTLMGAEVYETDGISSELHLSQDGHGLVHVQDRSELHIREDDSSLKIYVPRDPKTQGFCYFSTLPRRFLEWMMTDPVTLQILEAEGVVEVDIPQDRDGQATEDEAGEVTEVDLPVRQRSPATSNSSITGRRLFTPTSSTAEYFRQNRRTSSNVHRNVGRHESLQSTPRSASQPQPTFVFGSSPTAQPSSAFLFQSFGEASQHPTIEDEEEYLRLVSNVISAANTATLPSKGAYDMSGLFGALPEVDEEEIELSRQFRSHGLPERDMRIGALGELYVFELLRNMDPPLPRFSRDNWQSQMRKFVTIHPDYSDMLPWTAQETADIVYFDRKRVLTNHLVDKGYLDKTAWQNKKPLFLIEVKSTTGHSRTPFYMSKRQYQRMQENSNTTLSPATSPTVYLIARVSNVDKTNVEVKIYLDPEKLRQDGSLVFTGETWSIVPGPGST
ncbi:hypothetical protein FOC1_g10010770 [Fusarium oxysporum f. sp. cubense race 1]|uniref:Protein NO VEIN C-terminal domain-containing protein n=1 Tax=Fusarium oxysporum f. sp. cubense (strain race 1) TaxID=1229664 RepID=N4TV39_FUSC1|nr:hypothetical protein FOC1_g10010770 [Fusarium oxysporum f. sp. cubense race 1]